MASGEKQPVSDAPLDLLAHLSLEQVLQTIPSGLFLVDRGQRIVHWNTEAERITGYPAAEAIGRHCSFLSGIPCGDGCGLYNEQLAKPIIGVPCTVRTRDGRRISLLKNVDYLRDLDGEVIGGMESFIEITRLSQLEKRLRRQASVLRRAVRNRTRELEAERSWLRSVLDAMPDLAYIAGLDCRVEFMNRAMTETFGDQVGGICHEVLFGLHSSCPWCPMQEVLAGRTVREERQFGPSGRTYEVLHTPIRAGAGTIHKLAVFRDITDRKEMEKELQQANRELNSFVYTISHDLRTPLTPIIGYADFLQEEYQGKLDPQVLEILHEVEKQGRKALALMEDLLALSQVGRIELPIGPVDLNQVVAEALADLARMVKESGVRIEVSPLPGLRLPATMMAELFTNLIANAVRYAGGSGGPIEIGSLPLDNGCRLFVRDHGPGIPPGEQERIFDLFFRGSTAGTTPGTGIGLAIVRKIVHLYGGRIWMEETLGGGSTFFLEFPADVQR